MSRFLIVSALFGIGGCSKSESTPESHARQPWTSPVAIVARIEELCLEGEHQSADPRNGPPEYSPICELIDGCSDADREAVRTWVLSSREVRDGCKTISEVVLLQWDCRNGRKSELIDHLAVSCPDRIGPHNPIEYFLVTQSGGQPEAFGALFDAFQRAPREDNRQTIERAIHRSLSSLLPAGQSRDIAAAENWFRTHVDRLTLNRDYALNAHFARDRPLFALDP